MLVLRHGSELRCKGIPPEPNLFLLCIRNRTMGRDKQCPPSNEGNRNCEALGTLEGDGNVSGVNAQAFIKPDIDSAPACFSSRCPDEPPFAPELCRTPHPCLLEPEHLVPFHAKLLCQQKSASGHTHTSLFS